MLEEFERRKAPEIHWSLTIRRRLLCRRLQCLAYLNRPNLIARKVRPMEKLEQLLDSIDTAYRNASATDRDIASLLLVASLHVSQRIERLSGKRQQRKAA